MQAIDLKTIGLMCLRRIWLLLLAAVIGLLAAFSYTQFLVTPLYTSSVTMFISNTPLDSEGDRNLTSSDYTVSTMLVNTYAAILKSDAVLGAVADQLPADYTPAQLRDMLTVQRVGDTQIMQVDVENSDPQMAAVIGNAVLDIVPEKIQNVVKTGFVEPVDRAVASTRPSSPHVARNCVLGFAVGLVAAFLFFLVREVLDTHVKGEEDLRSNYDVPVLGGVPNFQPSKGGR